jgi:hypothetical protein
MLPVKRVIASAILSSRCVGGLGAAALLQRLDVALSALLRLPGCGGARSAPKRAPLHLIFRKRR